LNVKRRSSGKGNEGEERGFQKRNNYKNPLIV